MNYESARGGLPPSGYDNDPTPVVAFPAPMPATETPRGVLFILLPYIEQENLKQRFDPARDWRDTLASNNRAELTAPVRLFLCPSAPSQDRTRTFTITDPVVVAAAGGGSVTGAVAGYFVINRIRSNVNPATLLVAPGSRWTAALQPNVVTPVRFVLDGTSNTLALVEDAGNPALYRLGQAVAGQTTGGAGIWADHRTPLTFDGCDPATGDAANTSPNATRTKAVNCSNDDEVYAFHPGGANVLRCDGSVSFLRESVSLGVVAALVTRAAGEVLPDF